MFDARSRPNQKQQPRQAAIQSIARVVLLLSLILSTGCTSKITEIPSSLSPTITPNQSSTFTQTVPQPTPLPSQELPSPTTTPAKNLPYQDAQLPIETRIEDLLSRMTLAEKIGQMTQVEKNSIVPTDITRLGIGSLLSGGGGSPATNTVQAWADMIDGFQDYALATPLHIPLIYGVDAIHGHGNLRGATIFPQNIGLGATGDPLLVEQIGRATAIEMAASGTHWDFAPVVAVPQDIRWGRTYEGYSEDPAIVTLLGAAYVRGLQGGIELQPFAPSAGILATPKHFIGDGATAWGSSKTGDYQIDQGDMQIDEATLRQMYLPAYKAAVENGALSIMVSFSSWNDLKLHAHKYLLTKVLKNELSFSGFLISDWQAIDQIPGDYYSDVVTSINAGLDMIMVPYDYGTFIDTMLDAVRMGDIPLERIDDAVRRILRVKFLLGLFEEPYAQRQYFDQVGSDAHRLLARQAVSESLVLLKNENNALPIPLTPGTILVAGVAANDVGLQCGGWTIEWQGRAGSITPGTTILEGLRTNLGSGNQLLYDPFGRFTQFRDGAGRLAVADIGIVVVGEPPYAEGVGDNPAPALLPSELGLIERMRSRSKVLVLVVLSGRPVIMTEAIPLADAVVAAWWPGTEGAGVSDALFGKTVNGTLPFTGRLPYAWPRTADQLPLGYSSPHGTTPPMDCSAPLFPRGYGLSLGDLSPIIPICVEQ